MDPDYPEGINRFNPPWNDDMARSDEFEDNDLGEDDYSSQVDEDEANEE